MPVVAARSTITTLPWWMGAFIIGLWLAMVVAAVTIVRHRLRGRRGRAPGRPATAGRELDRLPTGERSLPSRRDPA